MNKRIIFRLIFLLCVYALLFLLIRPVFTITIRATTDGFIHKFRIISFIKSLHEGIIRPRWLADQAFGYGTPTQIYNWSVPYYAVSAINVFIPTVQKASEFFGAIIIILTFGSMFLFTQKLYGKLVGLVTAFIYVSAPNFLASIYIGDAWGEMTSYLFPPLILYFTLLLREKVTAIRSFCYVLLWFLFINSHNPSVAESAIPLVLLTVVLTYRSKKLMFFCVQLIICSFLCAAFFWIPALTLVKWIKYGVLIAFETSIRGVRYSQIGDYLSTAVSSIVTGKTNYYSGTAGIIILGSLLVSFFVLSFSSLHLGKKSIEKKTFPYLYPWMLLLIAIGNIFLTTPYSSFLWNTGLLNFILYPGRFLFVVTWSTTVLFAWLIRHLRNIWIAMLLCIIAFALARPYTYPTIDHVDFGDWYFETSPQFVRYGIRTYLNMGTGEFLPKWISDDFVTQQQNLYFTKGKMAADKIALNAKDGHVRKQTIGPEHMEFQLFMNKDTDVIINTSYYPDWQARVNTTWTPVSHDSVGRIQIHVPKGDVHLTLNFGYSLEEKLGFVVSFVGVLYLLFLLYQTSHIKKQSS